MTDIFEDHILEGIEEFCDEFFVLSYMVEQVEHYGYIIIRMGGIACQHFFNTA